jgi:hypothetical protein
MSGRRIKVVINRLALHGVPRGEAAGLRRALVEAVQAQLAGADPTALAASPHLRLDIGQAAGPAALGRAAGRALGGAIGGNGGGSPPAASRGGRR